MLAGVDGLAGRVRLVSGRLPRGCDETRCEVLRVAGEQVPDALELYDVPLRVVGTGRLDAVPLGPLPPPAGSIDAVSTFLVSDGVAPLLSIQALDVVPRTFTWTRVLDPAAVHPWNTQPDPGRPGEGRGRVRGDRRRRLRDPADCAAACRGDPRPRRRRVRADRRRAGGDRPARLRGVRRRRAARRRRRRAAPPESHGRPPPPPRRARAGRGGRPGARGRAGGSGDRGRRDRRGGKRGCRGGARRRAADAGDAVDRRGAVARGHAGRRRGARRWAVAQHAGGAGGRVPRRARRRWRGRRPRAGRSVRGSSRTRGRSTRCSCSRPARPRSRAG